MITPPDQPEITVDNIKIGQFIYLLLNNSKIRDIIDTITQRVVLILGRFTPERKCVLDALRELLRNHDYVPVVFDFAKPGTRTTLETVSTLAHMALFVIADITDAKSILQELQAVVPTSFGTGATASPRLARGAGYVRFLLPVSMGAATLLLPSS